jgi:hypothetical protein
MISNPLSFSVSSPLPGQAVMNELNSYSFLLRTFVSMWMNSIGVEIFMTRTVHEVLWGFKDPLLSKIHAMKPEVDEMFGLMWKVKHCLYSVKTLKYCNEPYAHSDYSSELVLVNPVIH